MESGVKTIQSCPICKKTVKEQPHWVRCPEQGQAVCMSHCYNGCIYHDDMHCRYRAKGGKKKDEG